MKRIFLIFLLLPGVLLLQAQPDKAAQLQSLEKNQTSGQNTITATLKSASRLFGEKDDLTTVVMIIPSGSTVTVLGSDSTYFHITFEDNEGYILKRHAVINRTPILANKQEQPAPKETETQPAQDQQMSRFSYLENKYGSNMAARLIAGKIWKGMNSELVMDSWGKADKINRVISGNIIKEEWIYKSTWLYFENNTLVEWGPVRQ